MADQDPAEANPEIENRPEGEVEDLMDLGDPDPDPVPVAQEGNPDGSYVPPIVLNRDEEVDVDELQAQPQSERDSEKEKVNAPRLQAVSQPSRDRADRELAFLTKEQAKALRKKYEAPHKASAKLVVLLRNAAARTLLSNKTVMCSETPSTATQAVNILDNTLEFYFKDVYGSLGERPREILKNYMTLVCLVYDAAVRDKPTNVFGPLLRFVLIAICFGIDRALIALTENDALFRDFIWTPEDTVNNQLYETDGWINLRDARHLYYGVYSDGRYDPALIQFVRLKEHFEGQAQERFKTVSLQPETLLAMEEARIANQRLAELRRKAEEKDREQRKKERLAQLQEAEKRARDEKKERQEEEIRQSQMRLQERQRLAAEEQRKRQVTGASMPSAEARHDPAAGAAARAPEASGGARPKTGTQPQAVAADPARSANPAGTISEAERRNLAELEKLARADSARKARKAEEERAAEVRVAKAEDELRRSQEQLQEAQEAVRVAEMNAQAQETRRRKEAAIKAQQEQFQEAMREAARRDAEVWERSEKLKQDWSNILRSNQPSVSPEPRQERRSTDPEPKHERRDTFYPQEDDPSMYQKPQSRPIPVGLGSGRSTPSILKKTPGDGRPGSANSVKFNEHGQFVFISDDDTDVELQGTGDEESDYDDPKHYRPRQDVPHHEEYLWADPRRDIDTDEEEDDPTKPAPPVHVSIGYEDPYVKTPLSKAGKIYQKDFAYENVPHKSTPIMGTALKDLQSAGCAPDMAKSLLTASAAMAQVISTLTTDHKKQQKRSIKEIPPPKNLDLRINSFNYNVQGNTATQILGKRFNALRFPSEPVRKLVMRKIFEKVVGHPLATPKARLIAINQLAQEDPLQTSRIELQALMDDSDIMDNDSEIVPPPQLGPNDLDSSVIKTLQTRTGMSANDRITFEDMPMNRLRTLLSNLRSVIQSAGLRQSEAFALMRRICSGNSYENVYLAESEHKQSFADYWVSLQKQKRLLSSKDYERRLKALLQADRVDNLEKTLNEILIYNDKISQSEIDPSIRKHLCQRNTLRDLRAFIRKHFSSYASQVNTTFMERLKMTAAQKNLPTYANEQYFHPGKSLLFLETAIETLATADPDNAIMREVREDRPSQKRHAQIHAITTSSADYEEEEIPFERPPAREEVVEQRGPTPGPDFYQSQEDRRARQRLRGRGGSQFRRRGSSRGPPRNQSRGPSRNQSRGPSRNQSRGPSRGPFRAQTPGGNGRRPDYTCHLCNVKGHSFRECRTYQGEKPTDRICKRCGGRHDGQCRSYIYGESKSNAIEHSPADAKIMAFEGNPGNQVQVSQPQPQGQAYGYPQDQNYNRSYTPGYGNQYRSFAPRYPTPGPYYNQNYRSRDQNYRSQTPGPGGPDYQRQPTPGWNGYRQNQYQQGNDRYYENRRGRSFYGRNNYRGGGRSGYRGNGRQSQNGDRGPNNYGNEYRNGPQVMGHKQIQQMEELLKVYNTQKLHAHASGQQGLGNDGHQPLTTAVVLNTMEASSQPPADSYSQ